MIKFKAMATPWHVGWKLCIFMNLKYTCTFVSTFGLQK